MAKEDWRLCADWLVRCQILAANHPVTQGHTEVFELAQLLRDGVLLCHLLNKLKPGSIDTREFSQRPQMCQFLCLKNIRVFLQTCQHVFGLKSDDLFEPNELFEVKDFGKVITALSRLSKSPEAKSTGIQGFSSSKKDYMNLKDFAKSYSCSSLQKQQKDETVYSGLDQIANEPDYDYYSITRGDEEDEAIYGDLVSLAKESKQGAGQARRGSRDVIVAPRPKTKREYCITELVETERNYVDVLNMLIQKFSRPLQEVMKETDHNLMFGSLDNLYKIHTGFHSDLGQACAEKSASRSNKTIPDCFVTWKDKFLIYGEYCSRLPRVQEWFGEIMEKDSKDPKLMQAIEELQMKASDGKFRLRDLISVPYQRVLKYHLLLKELIKNTDKEHRDRKALGKALEEMQDLSLYVNEVKRDNEALQLIKEIQDSIVDLQMPDGTALKDYGRLLKDGELKIKKHPENRPKQRYIFLFDKVMLMCKSRGETYNYKDALILSQFKIEEVKDRGFTFNLVEKSGAMAYTVHPKNEDLRMKWMEAIRMAHENTSPCGAREGKHDFIMHSFDVPTICDVCRKLLRGVFYQGYKCQLTNMAVHKECISKAKNMQGPPTVIPPPKTDRGKHRISSTATGPHSRPVLAKGKAKYTHQGNMPAQDGRPMLKFHINDVIDIIDDSSHYWWEGRLNGAEGFFPAEYVEVRNLQASRYEEATSSGLQSPVTPPSNGHLSPHPRNSYINVTDGMDDQPWFMGPNEMSRDDASKRLENTPSGTFLVRKSQNPSRPRSYALSIKYGIGSHSVKHIRIEQTADNSKYYLADCKMFNSVPDMIEYYRGNSLLPSFPELDTTLIYPYKIHHQAPSGSLGWCVAMFDYAANQPNQLSLHVDDRISVISKAGESRGWWKGHLNGRTGYFPCAYVEEED